MASTPEYAQEAMEAVQHPKEALKGAIHAAKETIIGSGSLTKEIKDVGSTCVDVPLDALKKGPMALLHLIAMHPIEATKRTASLLADEAGNAVKLATAPSRIIVAEAKLAGKVAKGAVKLPFTATASAVKGVAKSPFMAWNALKKGTDKLFKYGERAGNWVDS